MECSLVDKETIFLFEKLYRQVLSCYKTFGWEEDDTLRSIKETRNKLIEKLLKM